MANRVGVVVFGFGRIGRVHSRSLMQSHRAQILYVIDALDEETRKVIGSQEWNLVETHGTKVMKPEETEKALADKKVQAVIICAPTGHHAALIELACKYKKQIFCEKPVALSAEDAAKCYALAKSAGVALFCGFNRRFDPPHIRVQKAVASGNIGELAVIMGVGRDHPAAPDGYFAPNTVWKNIPNEEHWIIFDVEILHVEQWSPELQFQNMDTNNDGQLTVTELTKHVEKLRKDFGKMWPNGDIDNALASKYFLKYFDTDQNGKVTLDEYSRRVEADEQLAKSAQASKKGKKRMGRKRDPGVGWILDFDNDGYLDMDEVAAAADLLEGEYGAVTEWVNSKRKNETDGVKGKDEL